MVSPVSPRGRSSSQLPAMAMATLTALISLHAGCLPCCAVVLPRDSAVLRRTLVDAAAAMAGVSGEMVEAINASGFDGVSVYVGTVKQGELFSHSKGTAAPGSDTATPVASASKWVSGLMLMSLVQEGVMSLETKASDLLGYWSGEGTKGAINLHHLMSFTSGFMSLSNSTCIFSMPYIGVQACAQDVYQSYDEPLQFEPAGAYFGYSNEQLEVAAAMAEVATGKSWDELYQELVVGPLGLQDGGGFQGIGGVAGGLNISARDYASILTHRVMTDSAEPQPSPGDLLHESVALMNTDHTAAPEVTINVNKTFAVTVDPLWPEWHYGYAHWIECPATAPEWSPDCTTGATGGVHSSIGAFGFYPIVDFRSREGLMPSEALYLLIAPEVSFGSGSQSPMVMSLELADELRGILDEAFPVVSAAVPPAGPEDDSGDSAAHRTSPAISWWWWVGTAGLIALHATDPIPW